MNVKYYYCRTEEDAKYLMSILDKKGIRWAAGGRPIEYTHWDDEKENTCYRVEGKTLNYNHINNYYHLDGWGIKPELIVASPIKQLLIKKGRGAVCLT